MGQPQIDNQTPFAFEPLFVADEEGRPLLVPVVKATYELAARGLTVAAEQMAVNPAGEPYGDPAECSYKYEPECALPKLATDVVLVGSAVAPKAGTREMVVAFQVGPLKKGVRILGDRAFFKGAVGVSMSSPVAFERIPLRWERAFGGWDRSNAEERKHSCEPRNPVGVGHRGAGSRFEEGLPCPNLEEPTRPFKGWGDHPPPAGFGFLSPNWQPRTQYAGTYDQAWENGRAPFLPKDFDRRYFNAAPPDLVAKGYLRGDEAVVASGVTAEGGFSFKLPGVGPPKITVAHAGRDDQAVPVNLDTVIVDTDARKVLLFWRGQVNVKEATAVRDIVIRPGSGTPPRG
jgi:hypothetical protein